MRRVILIGLIVAMLGTGIAYAAYRVLTITGVITVQEAITIVESPEFTFTLYPQETATKTFMLHNASSLSLKVDLVYTCTPPEGPNDLKITVPNNVDVPAHADAQFTVQVEAKKSCPPGTWTVKIYVER